MSAVRQLFGADIQSASHSLRAYSFYASPPLYPLDKDTEQRQKYYANYRGFAYYEGEKAMSFALDIPMKQYIRGKGIPMSGIAAVVSHPTARGKGHVRETIAFLLKVGKESGSGLSSLFPFKESFYQRMGYVSFPLHRRLSFASQNLRSLMKVPLSGHVELYPMREAYEKYRAFLSLHAKDIHGFAWNEVGGWDERVAEGGSYWLALAYSGEEVIGGMLYQITGYEEKIVAERFYYTNSLAKYLLLNWLGRHEGQVGEVQINLPSYALNDTFWTDLFPKLSSGQPPMGRVIDIEGLKGLTVGEGELTIELSDPLCPWQEGVWSLTGKNGLLHIRKGGREAGIPLTVQGLSALVYGTHDPGDFVYRGWGQVPEEVQEKMRSMFSRQVPYIHEAF